LRIFTDIHVLGHAQRTGAGVGVLGENLEGSGHHHHHHHHHHEQGNTATSITNAGVQDNGSYGAQGTGGQYSSGQTDAALGAGAGLGAAGAYEAGQGQQTSSRQGEGYGTSGQSGEYNTGSNTNNNNNNNNETSNSGITGGQGHYGKASDGDFNRGGESFSHHFRLGLC
jgi:hypothetical protein